MTPTRPANPPLRAVLPACLVVVVLALLVGGVVLSPPRPGHPQGPHGIGTRTYAWEDPARAELVAGGGPSARRRIVAEVWYPATPDPKAPRAPYLSHPRAFAREASRISGMPAALLAPLAGARSNAVAGAPALPGRHPVVVLPVGLAGVRQVESFLVDDLVSHGYVVVGLDQPGASSVVVFPDGTALPGLGKGDFHRLLGRSLHPEAPAPNANGVSLPDGVAPYLAADVHLALDRLAGLDAADPILRGRVDLERVAVVGVSLGGLTAAQACHDDARPRACVVLESPIPDAVVRAGLRQPALVVTRTADQMREERAATGGWAEEEIAQHQHSMRALVRGSGPGSRFVLVDDMRHVDLTDLPRWSPLLRWLGVSGPDPRGAHEALTSLVRAFLDDHLRAGGAPGRGARGVDAAAAATSGRAHVVAP